MFALFSSRQNPFGVVALHLVLRKAALFEHALLAALIYSST